MLFHIVFEVELIKQIEINIDYILMLVKKYHDTHCEDKEVLITINKAIDASPELHHLNEHPLIIPLHLCMLVRYRLFSI